MNDGHGAQGDLRIVVEIGRELERAVARATRPSVLRFRPFRRGRATAAVVSVVATLTATAAAAGTGALDIGSLIPDGAPTGDDERADETVVATGATPVAGPWRMTTYTSKRSHTHDGQVMERGGLPCLRLMLTTAVTPISGSGWCGESNRDFVVSGIPVTTLDGRSEVILYGVAPEDAATVQLTAAGDTRVKVRTHERRGNAPGRPWVMAAPSELASAEVAWLDERGEPGGPRREVSSEFARARALERTLEPD